ncbi:MAG TPA: MFS transporter [Isosphaeraceae bacterium]|jgi:MFS family permease
MHFESPTESAVGPGPGPDAGPWYRGLTSYQWFVFSVAAAAWLFDTMDQQLFTLARKPAVAELLKLPQSDPAVASRGGDSTAIFMIGWALGGIGFGILGDRVGRARTLLLTILLYSLFTGFSALSWGVGSFAAFRFLTGLGVGGVFAVAVSLVAEVMPDRARPMALGWLQALSAVGNMIAALIGIVLGTVVVGSSWRPMFVIGILPALLAIPIFLRLKEPERWKKAALEDADLPGAKHRLGSLSELFLDPRWGRNTIVGMILAFSGVVGLWAIGFFSPDLVRSVFEAHFQRQGLSPAQINSKLTLWTGINSLLFNFGAFWGIYAFSRITAYTGRKPAFAISFVLALLATVAYFWFLAEFWHIFVLTPIMGFCQLAIFGGYAIYFPELFPTRLRSTGTSFCYNVGRLVASVGPYTLGYLTSRVYAHHPQPGPLRYAGVTMCAVFLLGLLALPFAPETKGQPLPE